MEKFTIKRNASYEEMSPVDFRKPSLQQLFRHHSAEDLFTKIDTDSQVPLDKPKELEFDMNGTKFNPDLYTERITREFSIESLLEIEKSLEVQIQYLNSDLQTLIYENYNKYIQATQAVNKMQVWFKGIDEKITVLNSNISQVIETTQEVGDRMKENQDKLGHIFTIHKKLEELELNRLILNQNNKEGTNLYSNKVLAK